MSDEDRRLFEQAVEELGQASRSKIGRLKGHGLKGNGLKAPRSGAAGASKKPGVPRPSARLDRKKIAPQASIDLHGLRRLDAARALRRFLEDRGRGEVVLIVHGKGSGALRRRVHELVAAHSRIAEWRQAPQRLGGEGALLARLKR